MIKTWFKKPVAFTEEEKSVLQQKGFLLNSETEAYKPSSDNTMDFSSKKTITKYDSFFVSHSSFEAVLDHHFSGPQTYDSSNEESFEQLDDAMAFFK
jgi:hypothetical protein